MRDFVLFDPTGVLLAYRQEYRALLSNFIALRHLTKRPIRHTTARTFPRSGNALVKFATLRTYALSLPEVTEEPHHQSGSFRVRGKIFVTIPPEQTHVHVFVSEEQRERALAMYPAFTEKLLWGGKVVGLRLALANAPSAAAKQLVRQAWEHKAPQALLTSGAEPGL